MSDNLQAIIKESLFFILSILFVIYYSLISIKHPSYQIMKDLLLFNCMVIVINETIFSLIFFISFLKDAACETSISQLFKSKENYIRTRVEEMKFQKMIGEGEIICQNAVKQNIIFRPKVKRVSLPKSLNFNRYWILWKNNIYDKRFDGPKSIKFENVKPRKLKHIFKIRKNPYQFSINKRSENEMIFVGEEVKEHSYRTKQTKKGIIDKLEENKEKDIKMAPIPHDGIISIHIGDLGCNIGYNYWLNYYYYETIQSEESPKIYMQPTYPEYTFKENPKIDNDEVSCRGLFINYNESSFYHLPFISNRRQFNDANFVFLTPREVEFGWQNFKEISKIMKAKIKKGLHSQIEKTDNFEGFVITHSAFEEAGCEIGYLFHEMASRMFRKKLFVNIPIYDIQNSSKSSNSIMNQIITTNYLQRYSNIIFPIDINVLRMKLSEAYSDILDQNEYETNSISNFMLMLVHAARKSYHQAYNLGTLVSLLIESNSHKFISSNLYPISNLFYKEYE